MIYARAISLRIYTKQLRQERPPDLDREGLVLVYSYGEASYAVVFRFGVVVFWNVPIVQQKKFLQHLEPFMKKRLDTEYTDEYYISIGKRDHIAYDKIALEQVTPSDVVSLSYPIAQSVVLGRLETEVDDKLYELNRVLRPIEKSGKIGLTRKQVMMRLGHVLRTRAHSFYEFGFEEAPSDIWDDDRIEKLYFELRDELEIPARVKQLNNKWDTMTEEMQFVLQIASDEKTLRIEIFIVAFLLFADILLTAWEVFGS